MKKTLAFIVLALVMSLGVLAAEPIIFDFSDPATSSSAIALTNMTAGYDTDLGYYKLTNTNYDANFQLKLQGYINAAEYPVVRHRFRIIEGAPSEKSHTQFFFSVSEGASMGQDGTYSSGSIKNTREWQDYTVNLSKIKGSKWSGMIKEFRVDPIQAVDKETVTMIIDFVAFFSSEEEANAYTSKSHGEVINAPATPPQETKPQETKPQETEQKPAEAPVSDAEPIIIYLNTEESDKLVKAKTNLKGAFDSELGYFKLVNTNHDPNFSLTFKEDTAFSTADYPVVRYRFKIIDGLHENMPGGQFFFATDNGSKMGEDGTYTSFSIQNTGGWQDVVLDLTNVKNSKWNGTVKTFRVDPIQAPDGTIATIIIDHIGFFPTVESAKADSAAGLVHKKGNQLINIPAESLKGNKKEDFEMVSEVVDTSAKLDGYEPVIFCKTADGKESVVALSWSNGKRFNYIARQPGQYRAAYYTKEYVDTADHWGLQYIRFVSARTLFGGTSETEFSPDMTMTRGMFVTVLGRMHGVDTALYAGATPYGDVDPNEYYAPYINWVTDLKIASPISEGKFGAEDPITRADMALMIANYTNAYNYSLAEAATSGEFNDLAGISDVAVNAIKQMQAAGIINGKGEGRFDPHGISTRAEVATVMARTIKSVLGLSLDFDVLPTAIIINPADQDTIVKLAVVGDGDIEENNDGITITGHSDQFYMTYTPAADETIYIEDYPYVKMMYRINSSPSKTAQFYYYTDKTSAHTAHPYVQFTLAGEIGTWNTMEFDFSTYEKVCEFSSSKTPWEGALNRFSIYPLRMNSGQPKTTRDMTIKYIAFFSTEEEMKAFDESKLSYENQIVHQEKGELIVSEKLGQDRIHIGAFFPYHADVTEEDIKDLAEAGLDISFVMPSKSSILSKDHILDWHAKHGVMAWIEDSTLRTGRICYTPDVKGRIDNSYGSHPAFYGNIFSDEPGIVHYEGIAQYIDDYKKDFPGKVGFVNLLPMYASNDQLTYGASAQKIDFYDTPAANFEDYIRRYAEMVDTHFICTDIYPLRWNSAKKEKETYKDYVKSIEIVAKVCRETDREFWCYIQSFASRGRAFFRSPDEIDIRWQAYSMLSFGIKTMLYYVWTETGDYFNTPINAEGEKNPVWYGAQKLNHEFIAISPVYLQYDNIGAFTHNSENVSYAQMLYPLESFAPIKEVSSNDTLLIGCFEKSEGAGYAFTLVNMNDLNLDTVAEVNLKIEGTKVTSYFDGQPQVVTPDANGYYNFKLTCGNGVFVTVE